MTTMLLLVIIAALLYDFANGWNDSANAIATVVSTRVLPPLIAVMFAAVLNFSGALVSTRVAKTIGGGLVHPEAIQGYVILAAMLAAVTWLAICTIFGLPISGSHSLIGGLIGAAVAVSGWEVVQWAGIRKVLIALVASPLFGFIIGYFLLVAVYWIAYRMAPRTVRRTFSLLQIFSSGFMASAHGMNDAQNAMGVITLALFSAGMIPDITVPLWTKLLCAVVIALGTATGGWRVIRTLGMRLSHIRPIEGFVAETAGGAVLLVATSMGIPVSTTHTITGSILGVGSAYRLKSVRWSIGIRIIYAWIITLPVTALLGALVSRVFKAAFSTM